MDNPVPAVLSGTMTPDADILIVGGGLNGPALALALAQGGLTSVVIDARPAPAREQRGFDGRAYSLAVASRRLLTAIGIWLAVSIADLRKTQDCVLMGRRDCARISVTPQG